MDNYKNKRYDSVNKGQPVKVQSAANKYLKYGIISLVALAVIAAIIIFALVLPQNNVATVGGEKITKNEFTFFLTQTKNSMLSDAGITAGTPEEENFWKNSQLDGQDPLEVAKKKALESAGELKIQVAKAKERKIKLEKTELSNLDASIEEFIDSYGNDRKVADEASIAAYGVKLSSVKKIYKQFLLTGKLYNAEVDDLEVPEADISSQYNADTKLFDKVTVRHILISNRDKETNALLSEDKMKEASAKAESVLAKVNAGGDFAALVNEYTDDTASKETGGEYTLTKFDSYVDEFKDWALKAEAGKTGIVETDFGFHVMKLEKREPVPFEEVKDKIKNEILGEMYLELMEGWKKEPKYEIVKRPSVYDDIK